MNLFRWLICKHQYTVTFFTSPDRAIANLTCTKCGQELIFLLDPKWYDEHFRGVTGDGSGHSLPPFDPTEVRTDTLGKAFRDDADFLADGEP